MPVDLRRLRYLITAADAGSITAAARALYLTQPALTLSLRKLEHEVGVPLLERHPRGVGLTPAGEVLVERGRTALAALDDATRIARRVGAGLGDELVIGLLPATFSRVIGQLIAAFRALHPGMRIRFRELSYISHTRDLTEGRVDAAFLWPPYDAPELTFLELHRERRVLGVAADHPLAGRDTVALNEVLDLPFPGFHPASSGDWFDGWFFTPQRGAPARLTPDEAATPFEMALIVQEGRAIAPAAASFAAAFPVPSVRWLDVTGAPPATLALAWNPAAHRTNVDALVRTARASHDPALTALAAPLRERPEPSRSPRAPSLPTAP
jgi:DNA-binding transcriptional LysR family regulator